jgi:hypothetical protein
MAVAQTLQLIPDTATITAVRTIMLQAPAALAVESDTIFFLLFIKLVQAGCQVATEVDICKTSCYSQCL